MKIDEAILEKQCNFPVKVLKNDVLVFSGTIGELQARYDTLGQIEVKNGPAYIDERYVIEIE